MKFTMEKRKKIERINRKCLVCGKKIRVVLYQDGHYRNGQYFNKLKLPIGKGEYKKIRTAKLFGKKINVVKWTGKEKEIEHWECDSCYNEAMNESWLEEIIEKLYGKKCKDYNKGCACCQAWSVYDMIIDYNRGRL